MPKILIIDDDENIRHTFWRIATRLGHEAVTSGTLAEGVARLGEDAFDCVFLDVRLPDGDGLKAIPGIKASSSSPEIVIITGFGHPDGAELAIASGAWSYLEKTSNVEQITLAMNQALAYRERSQGFKVATLNHAGIVGVSGRMRGVLDSLALAAASKANVLLLGDTGVGKELMARTIHDNSACSANPFVVVDCAAVPEHLVESILFGHVKGAFTGAMDTREGLVRQADGGTLFLDEVGELPLTIQGAFLRVIQERRFRPVGSRQEISSDFRLIAATNRNLEEMCASGQFRRDLLFRLKTIVIQLPPLCGRAEDIRSLAEHYVVHLCKKYDLPVKGVSSDVMEALCRHDWPGNVRELIHVLERMIIAAAGSPILHPECMPVEFRISMARRSIHPETAPDEEAGPDETPRPEPCDAGSFPTFKAHRKALLAEGDKAYLERLLEHTGGSLKRAYEIAGLSRSRLYILLKQHNLGR